MACITLLTDFGTQDEYVGVMKGVILSIDPAADIVDVTHGISAQNVIEAAHTLKAAFSFFPVGSIHLAVVDPGVGTDRDIIVVPINGHLLMAPNNGLLWPILEAAPEPTVYRVQNEELFRKPVSRTFHGRDIFAPLAAHLSKGIDVQTVGAKLPFDQVQPLAIEAPVMSAGNQIEGRVVAVDRFGNIITNIQRSDLDRLGQNRMTIRLDGRSIDDWVENYAAGRPGQPIAIIGSRDCLEIAVNGASAAETLAIGQGAVIRVIASG